MKTIDDLYIMICNDAEDHESVVVVTGVANPLIHGIALSGTAAKLEHLKLMAPPLARAKGARLVRFKRKGPIDMKDVAIPSSFPYRFTNIAAFLSFSPVTNNEETLLGAMLDEERIMTPLIAGDSARLRDLEPFARAAAKHSRTSFKLVMFERAEDVAIGPETPSFGSGVRLYG